MCVFWFVLICLVFASWGVFLTVLVCFLFASFLINVFLDVFSCSADEFSLASTCFCRVKCSILSFWLGFVVSSLTNMFCFGPVRFVLWCVLCVRSILVNEQGLLFK